MFKAHSRGGRAGGGANLVGVGDVEAAVNGALERAEDLGAGGGADEADVKDAGEGAVVALRLDQEVLAVRIIVALVLLIETHLAQQAARAEQASAVARGVVGQANLDAVLLQLVRVGRRKADVTDDLGGHHLADDVLRGRGVRGGSVDGTAQSQRAKRPASTARASGRAAAALPRPPRSDGAARAPERHKVLASPRTLLVTRTTRRYLGEPNLFLSCTTMRLRAW